MKRKWIMNFFFVLLVDFVLRRLAQNHNQTRLVG